MSFNSQNIEREVLGGIISRPETFMQLDTFLQENDFYTDVNQAIFTIVKSILRQGQHLSRAVLVERVNNLRISIGDGSSVNDYIEALTFIQPTEEAVIEAAKQLVSLRILREIDVNTDEIKKYINRHKTDPIDTIIAKVDSIYHNKISCLVQNTNPVNIFENLEQMIEETGKHPIEEVGLKTPFPEFNRLFGGLRGGNVYAIVSRPGRGKSTWIGEMCYGTSKEYGFTVPALILDTEMSSRDSAFRRASAITGVPMWYLESGQWIKNKEYAKAVRTGLKGIGGQKLYHKEVGNMTIDQICSFVRGWYYKNVGRGKPCIIAYDYVKLTGENIGNNWAEHQAIGAKIDKLKKLAEELNAPLISAMQLNRSGEHFNKKAGNFSEDSSAIALSDRLQWFASFVAIFRDRTLDEIELEGTEFGTHKLIPLKTRFQGMDSMGFNSWIKMPNAEGKIVMAQNFLNYEVSKFRVSEMGSGKDVAAFLMDKISPDQDDQIDQDSNSTL